MSEWTKFVKNSSPLKGEEAMKIYEPMCGTTISYSAEQMVALANESDEVVSAEFNGIEIKANPGDDPQTIMTYYHNECERQAEEYRNSPEGKKAAKEAAKFQKKAEAARAEGIKPFSLKEPDGWKQFVDKNQDGYGSGVIRYAARWANLMEEKIAKGAKLEDIAKATSSKADVEGITGFMYGCAVNILSEVWTHGEQLRRWHNLSTQIGNEGEVANESGGVLNPALLSISPQ